MALHRTRLSWKEKKLILDECRRRNVTCGQKSIEEVWEWAKKLLKLHKTPAYKTVLSIIRDRTRIDSKAQSTHQHLKKK